MAERRLEPIFEQYFLGPSFYKNVTVDITEYVLGNITVLEADSWTEDHVRANIYKTFSDPDIDDVIDFQISNDEKYETFLLRADLHSTDEEGRKKEAKIMKNNCARIDIELIYPKSSGHLRLAGKTRKGGHIRIRTEGKLVIFDDVQMETTVGDILFEAGSVKNSAKLKTGKGKIQGTIRSQQQVEATTTLGDIALVVDASPGELGASFDKLNITLQSAKSSIELGLTQRYHGWFSLKSGIDKPTFTLSPNYTDSVTITKSSATSLAGWCQREPCKALYMSE
ncbi:hypothetical protein BGX24_000532 [Mortierella sp. AD032]|nr:hypothetical protein BGX24_000532 [Mortierella sp. AD032]